MGIAYRCAPKLRCAFIVWDGDVTPDQWTAHFERLVSDPAYASCSRAIVDLSSVGGHEDITDEVIQEMATRWRGHAEEVGALQWAIVPNGAWSRARKFEEELETFPGIHTMLFNHAGTASIWLGIDIAETRPILDSLRDELRAERRSDST